MAWDATNSGEEHYFCLARHIHAQTHKTAYPILGAKQSNCKRLKVTIIDHACSRDLGVLNEKGTCCTGHAAANNRLGHGFVSCTGVTGRHGLVATSYNQMQVASIDILKDSWSTNRGWREGIQLYGWTWTIMAFTNSSTVKTLQQYFNEITQYNFHTPSLDYTPTNYIYNKLWIQLYTTEI